MPAWVGAAVELDTSARIELLAHAHMGNARNPLGEKYTDILSPKTRAIWSDLERLQLGSDFPSWKLGATFRCRVFCIPEKNWERNTGFLGRLFLHGPVGKGRSRVWGTLACSRVKPLLPGRFNDRWGCEPPGFVILIHGCFPLYSTRHRLAVSPTQKLIIIRAGKQKLQTEVSNTKLKGDLRPAILLGNDGPRPRERLLARRRQAGPLTPETPTLVNSTVWGHSSKTTALNR